MHRAATQLDHAPPPLASSHTRRAFWSLCCAWSSACLAQTSRPGPDPDSRCRHTPPSYHACEGPNEIPAETCNVFVCSCVQNTGGSRRGRGGGVVEWVLTGQLRTSVLGCHEHAKSREGHESAPCLGAGRWVHRQQWGAVGKNLQFRRLSVNIFRIEASESSCSLGGNSVLVQDDACLYVGLRSQHVRCTILNSTYSTMTARAESCCHSGVGQAHV